MKKNKLRHFPTIEKDGKCSCGREVITLSVKEFIVLPFTKENAVIAKDTVIVHKGDIEGASED